jgi:hypothetical protein
MPHRVSRAQVRDYLRDFKRAATESGRTEVHGQLVYIKLKLVGTEPLRRALCLSFHRAEHTMSFPFRE